MKQSGTCPKCDSTDIIADAKVIDRARNLEGEITIVTYRNPQAMIFKERQESTLSAWVCGSCGYTEFYADRPHAIKRPKS